MSPTCRQHFRLRGWVKAGFGRHDLQGDWNAPTTVCGTQRVQVKFGKVVLMANYAPTGKYRRPVTVLQLHSSWSCLRYNCNGQKERLVLEIEQQRALGNDGLLEEDKYLAEVNLDNMATTTGEQQHYWLLGIKTARKAKIYGSNRTQWQQQTVIPHSRMGKDYRQIVTYTSSQVPCPGVPRTCLHEEETSPVIYGFTATLFGFMPSACEDSVKVKLV
jgi:hypothetical protein